MTPDLLRQFRKRLKLTQVQFADVIRVSPNTVARWERGEIGMRRSTEQLIRSLMQHYDLTTPVVEPKDEK